MTGRHRHHLPEGHRAPDAIIPVRHYSSCPLGVIQLPQLSSPRLHFVFAVFPHAHVLCLISEGGADALNTEDPAGVGLNLLSPLLFSTERVYPPSLRGHRARCPFGLQIRAGRGSCGSRSAQRCVSDELFPGLCLPGCPLRVTVCVMVRARCSCPRAG